MSDERDDGYGGTLARKCREQMNREAGSSFAAPAGYARASVRLSIYDWKELVNFVEGDLANMDDDEVYRQMRRICDTIKVSYLKAKAHNR